MYNNVWLYLFLRKVISYFSVKMTLVLLSNKLFTFKLLSGSEKESGFSGMETFYGLSVEKVGDNVDSI